MNREALAKAVARINARAERHRKQRAAEEVIVYLREIDPKTDAACWVVCAKGDPGAVAFTPSRYED